MDNSNLRKRIAFITTLALVVSSTGVMGNLAVNNINTLTVSAVDNASSMAITESSGYSEGAYVEWTGSTSDEYSVFYKNDGGSYTQIDSMLIRQYADHFRADVVGIPAGNYTLKVVGKSSGEMETSTLTVTSYDRSGFCFSKNSTNKGDGVGAYNNDGTLKAGTQVIYVTEATKNTVTADINGTTQTGIANITQQAKKCTTPLCFRIIGQVTLDGLASSDMKSAYAMGVKEASNITIEGIGEDATLYGAGLAAFKCHSIEMRNLGLMLWGGGKDGDGITLKESENVWVHNNDVFYGEAGSDSDQAKGDGSMDLKDDSKYITISYNHFWDSGKMSLCGMKSETGENWITYHHNWFDHSDSRHPRIRTMSVHVYNNYYDGNSKYGVGCAYKSEAFVEANYFRNCKYPMLSSMQGSDVIAEGIFSGEDGGVIKSYGNYMEGQSSYITYQQDNTDFDAYEVTSRDEQVPSSVTAKQGGKTYSNFDTNSDIMYDYTPDKAEDVPTIVMNNAGRLNGGDFQFDFDDSVDDTSYSVNSDLMNKLLSYKTGVISIGSGNFSTDPTPTVTTTSVTTNSGSTTNPTGTTVTTAPISGSGAVHNFTTDGVTSTYYTIAGNLTNNKGTMQYNGLNLTQCLKLESSTSIGFTASTDTTLTLVTNTATYIKIDGEKVNLSSDGITEIPVSAGKHTITKGDSGNLFYMATGDTGSVTQPSDTTTSSSITVTQPSDTVTTTSTPDKPSVVTDAIYCSPSGTGDGSSIDNPTSVLNAISSVKAGGVIYLLDGTYNFSETILIDENNCGTADAYKTIMAYPNANVVWDFSAMPVDGSNRGVVLDGDYWHFYGFEITKAGDNGMLLSGNNNVIQMMIFSNNQDTGLQLSRYNTNNATIDTWPSNNLILNCTSKNNCDDATMENADGFAAKLTCGEGNVFDGCMSYNNSDDGWDLFAKDATGPIGVVTIQNCIAFRNGYTEDGRGYGDCDGNGFKLGGSGVGSAHVVKNCLAFENLHCGFTDNNNPKLESLTDCTAFNNNFGKNGKPNFSVYRCTDDGCDFKNILSYYNANGNTSNDKFVGTMENSVLYNSKYYKVTDKIDIANGYKGTADQVVTLSDSDFISVTAPDMGSDFHKIWRNADGSINTNGFMQLAENSSFAEMGSDLVKYNGKTFDTPKSDTDPSNPTVTTTSAITSDSNPSDTTTTVTSDNNPSDTTTTVTSDDNPNDTTTSASTGDVMLGDVNGDGSVRVNDIQLIRRVILHIDDPFVEGSREFLSADVSKDGSVRVNDIQLIRQLILHMIDSFE